MAKTLKKWQGWVLFIGSMAVVFVLGLLVSSLMERRAEVASVFNNKRTVFEDSIVAQNEKFKADYPREYETWAMTEDTSFESKYNGSEEVDVLEQRPEMVVLWAGYAFSRHYNTPRGHKHALEDMRKILKDEKSCPNVIPRFSFVYFLIKDSNNSSSFRFSISSS